MGGKTRSAVEHQIEQWRKALATSEAFGTSDLDKLESHVREEMDRLQPLGLSNTESFLVARPARRDRDPGSGV